MSDTCKANLIKGMQASFIDFQASTLPKYTLEELSAEIEKGEKSFFTPKALSELQDLLSKSEMDEETALSFAEQIQTLEKVAIIKGEEITGYGYFLEKATYKDNPANRKAGRVGQTYGGKKEKEESDRGKGNSSLVENFSKEKRNELESTWGKRYGKAIDFESNDKISWSEGSGYRATTITGMKPNEVQQLLDKKIPIKNKKEGVF